MDGVAVVMQKLAISFTLIPLATVSFLFVLFLHRCLPRCSPHSPFLIVIVIVIVIVIAIAIAILSLILIHFVVV